MHIAIVDDKPLKYWLYQNLENSWHLHCYDHSKKASTAVIMDF